MLISARQGFNHRAALLSGGQRGRGLSRALPAPAAIRQAPRGQTAESSPLSRSWSGALLPSGARRYHAAMAGEMTAAELIRRAAECQKCGIPHEYRPDGPIYHTWASEKDGHAYQPRLQSDSIAELMILAGITSPPWELIPG